MNGHNGTPAGSMSVQGSSSAPASNQWHQPAPSLGEHTFDTTAGRILCIADIRGKISKLNDLADRHNAKAIIHTGDFGFYDKDSVERITNRTLRHVVQYSSLIDNATKEKYFPLQENPKEPSKAPLSLGQLREAVLNPSPEQIKDQQGQEFILSEFPKLLSGEITLKVPVYTVWGACEDVHIIEKLRLAAESKSASPNSPTQKSEYAIPNLTVLSEGVSRLLLIGGIKLRLFGLGGSVVHHKLFDNGEGNATIAGGGGTMWTTALQIGELVDTAQRVYDVTETRMLITHASPGREGLLAQLALAIKADYTISGSLHFRYGSSYNDFGVSSDPSTFRNKLVQSSKRFREVYDIVKSQVDSAIDNQQKKLLKLAVAVTDRIPAEGTEEFAWKNSWHWNLPDALFGSLVLDIRDGRLGSEQKSTGFNFAYRLNLNSKSAHPREAQGSAQTQSATSAPNTTSANHPQSQLQAGPSKKPVNVPFHQQRVFSNSSHNNAQRQQEPPKQGYLGGAKPQQAQDSQQTQQASTPASEGTQSAAEPNAPPAGPSLGPRGPPTPRAFEQLASNIFKKPVGSHGAPGAGRGRGSPSMREGGHQKNSSSGAGRSSPADPIGTGRKDAESKQVSAEGTLENGQAASMPVPEQGEGESNAETKPTEDSQIPPNQRRSSGFNQGPRGSRDNSANWRDRNGGERAQQSEASGNESPGVNANFRGRGRGRGSYDGGRGGGESGRARGDNNFRGGRPPRGDGPFRGNSFEGNRGNGRGRGSYRGDSISKEASPAPEKPKTPAPAPEAPSA